MENRIEKRCLTCKENKPISEFKKFHKNMGDGYSDKCNGCKYKGKHLKNVARRKRIFEFVDIMPIYAL
jgi:hypothetical protein